MRHLLFVFLFAFAVPAFALDKYVAQSGGASCSSGAGSPMSVANFNSGSCSISAGDTVHFSGEFTTGPYLLNSGASAENRVTYDFSGATLNVGGCADQITFRQLSYINIFGGTFDSDITCGMLLDSDDWGAQSYVTISGWTYNGPTSGAPNFVRLNYVSYSVIENNHIDNHGRFITAFRSDFHHMTVRNNFSRTCLCDGASEVDNIAVGDSHDVLIEGNYMVNRTTPSTPNHADVLQLFESTGFAPYAWEIRHNWIEFDGADGTGGRAWFQPEDVNDADIVLHNNVFVSNASATLGLSVTLNSSNNARFHLYNNTFAVKSGSPGCAMRFMAPGTLYMKNNIGYSDMSSEGFCGTTTDIDMLEGDDWNYNFFYNIYDCTATERGANGSCTTNPLLEDPANDQLWPTASSTLIGAGVDLGASYKYGLQSGTSFPNPTLIERTGAWTPGAYVFDADDSPVVAASGRGRMGGALPVGRLR